jgi:hypothetical protein
MAPSSVHEPGHSLAHLLRASPDPQISVDAGDRFQAKRHPFGTGAPAVEDMAEKVSTYLRPPGNLLLVYLLSHCPHGQLIRKKWLLCQQKIAEIIIQHIVFMYKNEQSLNN